MQHLNTADRRRLAKLLALAGSDQIGERAAAAMAAHNLITKRGLTWREVIEPAPVEKRLPELGTWRKTVAKCLGYPGRLRPWELGFLRDLPGFRRLSVKQRYVLKEIARRVLHDDADNGF